MVAIAFDDSVAVLIPQVCMGLHVVVGFPLERCLKHAPGGAAHQVIQGAECLLTGNQ